MTITVRTEAEAGQIARSLAPGLPLLYGTGYPCETPHIVFVNRYGRVNVHIWRDGDRYVKQPDGSYKHTTEEYHLIRIDPCLAQGE